jgi:hypothetical protein
MIKHDIIIAVKELLERDWSVDAIAAKLWVPADTVQAVVDMIQGTLL